MFYTNIKSCHTHRVSKIKREEGGMRGRKTPTAAHFSANICATLSRKQHLCTAEPLENFTETTSL